MQRAAFLPIVLPVEVAVLRTGATSCERAPLHALFHFSFKPPVNTACTHTALTFSSHPSLGSLQPGATISGVSEALCRTTNTRIAVASELALRLLQKLFLAWCLICAILSTPLHHISRPSPRQGDKNIRLDRSRCAPPPSSSGMRGLVHEP